MNDLNMDLNRTDKIYDSAISFKNGKSKLNTHYGNTSKMRTTMQGFMRSTNQSYNAYKWLDPKTKGFFSRRKSKKTHHKRKSMPNIDCSPLFRKSCYLQD